MTDYKAVFPKTDAEIIIEKIEWISVKDRMPNLREHVLVNIKHVHLTKCVVVNYSRLKAKACN
jgi:hypothetical protein